MSELTTIASRNAELADALRAICKRFDVDTNMSAEDAAKSVLEALERDWMRLPVDADGVPIKPGERFTFEMNDPGMCTGYDFLLSEGKWMLVVRDNEGRGGCRFIAADKAHHVKPDTVESVLEELVDDVRACVDTPECIAEYAERIRKAVEQ